MERLRRTVRRIRAELYTRLGVARRIRNRLDGSCAAILAYHRVLPDDDAAAASVEPGMYVTPETFRVHLTCLRREFRVLPLRELVTRLRAGKRVPERSCAISFDDGWRDNHEHAWPALREAGLPATIFLVTDRVGTAGDFWPDEVARRIASLVPERLAALDLGDAAPHAVIEALKRLPEPERERRLDALRAATPDLVQPERPLLDWNEVQAMTGDGIDFESHAASHAILTGLSPERVQYELTRSRATLHERGLGAGALLAYPNGSFDADVMESARRAGYVAAFTTEPALAQLGHPLHRLPRLGLHEDVSGSEAEFQWLVPGRGVRHR
jgi:peptidoglycan/xylan/chitin deacetylase (PgdA/CDA1 family)